jgi:hypothetical protein
MSKKPLRDHVNITFPRKYHEPLARRAIANGMKTLQETMGEALELYFLTTPETYWDVREELSKGRRKNKK